LASAIGDCSAGKTCSERPDSRRIWIAGVDQLALGEVDLLREHRRFAVVFQNDALLDSLSVFDNVAFPLREELGLHGRAVEERVMRKLDALGIADARDKLVGELSGGMAKRLGVARADSSAVEPKKLVARRSRRKPAAEIRAAWLAAHAKKD